MQALHAAFIDTFNTTRHWAHQEREDRRRTPVEVLEWVRGRPVERAVLRQLFGEVSFLRTVNRYGFVSVQRSNRVIVLFTPVGNLADLTGSV
jgi:hypothetical protein